MSEQGFEQLGSAEPAPGSREAFPVTTAFDFPTWEIQRSLGTCFGLVCRSMGALKGLMAGFRTVVGGEVTQYTELLEDSRRHAMDRMIENARLMGANGESPVPAGHWEPTEEVFRDPSSGRRMRVWIDPGDASRHYVPEPD